MKARLSKADKQFLLTTSLYNRDFFISIASLRVSLAVALTAVVASVFSIFLTLKIVNPIYASIGSFVFIVAIWLDWYRSNKRLRGRIDQIQKQYREFLTDLYPEIKESEFYY